MVMHDRRGNLSKGGIGRTHTAALAHQTGGSNPALAPEAGGGGHHGLRGRRGSGRRRAPGGQRGGPGRGGPPAHTPASTPIPPGRWARPCRSSTCSGRPATAAPNGAPALHHGEAAEGEGPFQAGQGGEALREQEEGRR